MVLRLTDSRARAMLPKEADMAQDLDVPTVWRPSPSDRRRLPDLPPDCGIPGRVVVRRVSGPGGKEARLCLFASRTDLSADELVELYAKRWSAETDFRTLKATLGLETLRAKSPGMAAKELVLGVAACNLVRAAMALAAKKAGVEPRRLSFARARACIEAFSERGAMDEKRLDEMFALIAARLLPDRSGRRSFPRRTWHKRHDYPPRMVEVLP